MMKKGLLEAAVMNLLWDADGPLTPRDVRERLQGEHDVAYTTVMTVLVRLLNKGRVERAPRGSAYEYTPTLTREDYAAARMTDLLAVSRDRPAALAAFANRLSREEKKRLRESLGE